MKHARAILAAVLLTPLFGGLAHSAPNYQDAWWDPSQSGMGVMILHQSDVVAAAWYFFGSDGKATYMLLSGPLNGNSVSGSLRRSTGPQPGPGFKPSSVAESSVGTGTLTFTSSTTATLTYSFEGLSDSLQLTRMSIAQPNLNGTVTYAAQATRSQCSDPTDNTTDSDVGTLTINRNDSSLKMSMVSESGTACSFSTNLSQAGTVYAANGTFTCSNGVLGGTASFSDLRVTDDFLSMNYTLDYTQGDTCRESGKIGGILSR